MNNERFEVEILIKTKGGVFRAEIAREFWAKTKRGDPGECWPWRTVTKRGYSVMRCGGATFRAQRIAWLLKVGPIPKGCQIYGCITTKECVNPEHLRAMTLGDFLRGKDGSRGQRSPVAKLSEAQVLRIRSLHPGKSLAVLSKEFGVHLSTISLIVNRRRWKHI